jgi:tetratricopeptide (TPR) repeat protein
VHAEALPPEERTAALGDITVRRAHSLYYLGRVRESIALLGAVDRGVPHGEDARRAAEIRFWLAHAHSHVGNPEEAGAAARAAAELGSRAGSMSVLGRARYVLAREGWWTGRWAEGIAEGEAAVPILEETGEAWWLGHCLCYIGHGHRSLGRFDEALAAARRARSIGDASGDPRVRSFSGWSRGWYLAVMGRTAEAIEACEEAIAVSPDPANSAWALGFLGFAHAEDGRPSLAIDALSRAIADVRRADHPRVQCWFEGWLADALLAAGRPHDARATARRAVVTARRVECPWAAAHATRSLGRIALAEGDLSSAGRLLGEACAAYAALGGRFDRAVTLLDVAQSARVAGDGEAAARAADAASGELADMPVGPWRERAAEAAAASPR